MHIGIIGSGNVGGTLGTRWARGGHHVVFASRSPESGEMRKLVEESAPNSSSGTAREAVGRSEILLLATPWTAAQEALQGAGDLTGKLLIDATNPVLPRLAGLAFGNNTSGAEQVAGWAPGAKVVKAFNTVGANVMGDTSFQGGRVAMFYCGDDAEAKKKVAGLIEELGFEPLDAGPLKQARLLEPLALLWISLAMQYGYGREIAFQFMRR